MMTTGKTSDDYKPCVAMWPNGEQRKTNVAHIRLDTVDNARRELAAGHVVWVAPEDVGAVMMLPVTQA